MNWRDYVHQDPKILCGKPVLMGTRISVELILEELAAGDDVAGVLKSYPHLTENHVRAALAYAADSLKQEETVFFDANIAL